MVETALLEEAATQPQAAGFALQIRNVSHHFDLHGCALPVLDRVGFDVAPGEFVAVLGPSGCGKSTLLRLIAGLDPVRSGSIVADGKPVRVPDPSRLMVFQDPTLYPWRTVWNNVALGFQTRGLLKQRHGRVDEVLRLVGLENFAGAFPHQLSGGMAQRAALARAIVDEPRLLLLDEPLGRLDSLTRLTMQGELLALWRRARFTALLVTHDVEEALLLASRLIVLSGRPAQVKAELRIDLPYPRHRDDPALRSPRRDVLRVLGLESAW